MSFVMTMVTIAGVRILTIMTVTGAMSGMNAESGKSVGRGMPTGVGIGTTVDIPTVGIGDIQAAAYGLTSEMSTSRCLGMRVT
jgi:hypothetical protein